MAVVRSPDFLRALIRETALATLIHQRRLTPSCGGHAPTAERTVGPARMIAESLTPKPGIREQYLPGAAVSSRSKTVALFDPLVGAVAKAGRPADAHKRLIRVWNCKFIHSPWLVLWSPSSRAEVLQRTSNTIDIFKIKIESERISTWDEPAFLRPRQVEMPACTVG